MFSSLSHGMVIIYRNNSKQFKVLDRSGDKLFTRYNSMPNTVRQSEVADFYISLRDISAMKPFNGKAYIKKYGEHTKNLYDIHIHSILHAQMKAIVDSREYLPITQTITSCLTKGMRVIHNGGSRNMQGKIGTITDMRAAHVYHSAHSNGIAVLYKGNSRPNTYSREWFAESMYVLTTDLAKFKCGAVHVAKLAKYALKESDLAKLTQPSSKALMAKLEATKYKQHEEEVIRMHIKRAEQEVLSSLANSSCFTRWFNFSTPVTKSDPLKEYNEHKFSLDIKPTSWLAIDLDSGERLTADTEGGIKAKVTLALAKDNSVEYQIFARVGGIKAEPTLKFIK